MTKNTSLPPMLVRHKDPLTGAECVYPKSHTLEQFSSALKYIAKPTDVFVCSFPKSGTTWLQYIVWQIIHKGNDFPETKTLRKVMPMLEFDGKEVTEAIDTMGFSNIIKTHFYRHLVPYNKVAKYIYIARNPKDVIVSYLFHCRGFPGYEAADLKIEDIFDAFAYGEIEFGNQLEHIAEWYRARDEENVLFVLYEALKKNPEKEILRIASFLGEEHEESLLQDDKKLLQFITQKTSFSSMSKENNAKWVTSKRTGTSFVRKGVVGDYVNYLTKEQITILDEQLKEKGQKLGINELWREFEAV